MRNERIQEGSHQMKAREVNLAVLLTAIHLCGNLERFVLLPLKSNQHIHHQNHNTNESERKRERERERERERIDQRDIATLHSLHSHGGNTSLASVLSFNSGENNNT